jgi:predicted alpha/beta hydrolase
MAPPPSLHCQTPIRVADGSELSLSLFHPPARIEALPVLLLLPAMGTPAAYYGPFARELAGRRRAIVALADLRGQGASSVRARRGAEFGYREIVEVDLPALAGELGRRFPGHPLLLAGHSLGGQLALLAAARQPRDFDGLVLLAAGTAHAEAWRGPGYRRAAFLFAAVRAVARLAPWYPGHLIGFCGEQPRRLMRDWGRVTRTGRYAPEGSRFDYESALRALDLPILAVGIAGDPVAPPAAIAALLAKTGAERIELATVAGIATDSPWRRHLTWARRPETVLPPLEAWLERRFVGDAAAAPFAGTG